MFTSFHGWHDTLEQQQKKILSEPKKISAGMWCTKASTSHDSQHQTMKVMQNELLVNTIFRFHERGMILLPSVDKLRKKDSVIWRLDNFKWFSPSNMLEQQSDLGNQAHSCTQLNFIEHALEQAYNKHNYIELPRTISLSGSSSSPTVSKTHPSGFF